MKKQVALALVMVVGSVAMAQASIIHLKNGDRIKGEVTEDNAGYLKVNTELLGVINISKDIIVSVADNDEPAPAAEAEPAPPSPVVPEVKPEPAPKVWSHSVSVGFTTTNGNNKTAAFNATADSEYTKDRTIWKIKNILDYANSKNVMTTQKYFGKAQNDYQLGDNSKWFNTRSVEVTHDKFANVDYRVLPALGFGYWFWKKDDTKSELDLALGYEYTNYNTTDTKSTGNLTLIPHYYIDRTLFGKSKISQDLTLYPSLESFADYRLRSETAFVNPISDTLSWKISFIDEFNSAPKGNAKKNDTTLTSSLQVSF